MKIARNPGSFHLSVIFVIVIALIATSCTRDPDRSMTSTEKPDNQTAIEKPDNQTAIEKPDNQTATAKTDELSRDPFVAVRRKMVDEQMAKRDIVNEKVLDAMRRVPRHRLVPEHMQKHAYDDSPLPIGEDQTISQPYIVALMTQLVDPQPQHKALDIGAGSGYQAAVLAELVESVYSIEIVESLATSARENLKTLGYSNIEVRHGDGYRGWKSEAPFDVIIIAAAPDHIPQALVEQLAPGGKMVIPIGKRHQELILIEKDLDGTVNQKAIAPVLFVPMTGEARK